MQHYNFSSCAHGRQFNWLLQLENQFRNMTVGPAFKFVNQYSQVCRHRSWMPVWLT